VRGEELIDEQDFLRTEFCADWCSRVDIFHMIGCTYPLPGGLVGGSSVHRTRRQGAFDDADKRLYAMLMGHFVRAVELSLRLGLSAGQDAVAPDVVEALDLGVILVDAERRVLQANRVAEAVLTRTRRAQSLPRPLRFRLSMTSARPRVASLCCGLQPDRSRQPHRDQPQHRQDPAEVRLRAHGFRAPNRPVGRDSGQPAAANSQRLTDDSRRLMPSSRFHRAGHARLFLKHPNSFQVSIISQSG